MKARSLLEETWLFPKTAHKRKLDLVLESSVQLKAASMLIKSMLFFPLVKEMEMEFTTQETLEQPHLVAVIIAMQCGHRGLQQYSDS